MGGGRARLCRVNNGARRIMLFDLIQEVHDARSLGYDSLMRVCVFLPLIELYSRAEISCECRQGNKSE